jgi:hypothetical protein
VLQLGKEPMQSEIYCNETMASDFQAEHSCKAYQELIHSHYSKRRNSYCIRTCNDADICSQSRKIKPINDVTDARDNVNNCCADVKALVPLTSGQAECLKQDDAEYLEMVASDAADNGVCGDSKPSSCQANCLDQYGDNYLQLVANDDHLQQVANDDYLRLVANDDHLQQVANDDHLQQVANDDHLQLVANDDYLQQVAINFR